MAISGVAPASNSTLRLDLDHTGCVVEDLGAGAAKWERLGFSLTPLSRQRGAVPGLEGFHPWATANRCVVLGDTYLELIGTVDPAAFNPWARFIERNEGLHILALRCDDAEAAYATLSSRTEALFPPVARERVLDVDGEPRTMRFRNIFSRDEEWPEARYLVIEHQTPVYLWQPRYQQQENGACDLLAVTLVHDDPLSLMPRLHALGAQYSVQDNVNISGKLAGRGSIHVMRTDAFADMYGYRPHAGMQGMTVAFAELEDAIELLERRGVVVGSSAKGAWIGPSDTNGFVMHLMQREKNR